MRGIKKNVLLLREWNSAQLPRSAEQNAKQGDLHDENRSSSARVRGVAQLPRSAKQNVKQKRRARQRKHAILLREYGT